MPGNNKKILFLAPYPFDQAPSQRFRFEQYFPALKENNIEFDFFSFYSMALWKHLVQKNNPFSRLFRILFAFCLRFFQVLHCYAYDRVFIHRETCPAGPPIFEWIIAKVFRKKIIYDFDDAIWLTDDTGRNAIKDFLKWKGKVARICRWSRKVSCGNDYLCEFSLQYNAQSFINPTTIDMVKLNGRYHQHQPGKIIIGWTGSHTTLKYLYTIGDELKMVLENSEFLLSIICNKKPKWDIAGYRFIEWNKNREVDDLLTFDIGLMPLPDDLWTRGKCGFKALQYLSLGIPALVSPLPVNKVIVDHGINGYYCTTPEDWITNIKGLATDTEKRKRFGENGRQKIRENYSTASNLNNFLGLFE